MVKRKKTAINDKKKYIEKIYHARCAQLCKKKTNKEKRKENKKLYKGNVQELKKGPDKKYFTDVLFR